MGKWGEVKFVVWALEKRNDFYEKLEEGSEMGKESDLW